ncbi:GNAT family N-acetyltransferase [Scleromatobacter humisilvae]|uniref:GNAT family N-acetyltransferase n=1 Tax=Scleromatobacter humisilvae TaxID=2897159 RepID=A0A9X1YNQ9_9BURK|nr:GNAT family protein [Scleromatobacter humisilvae]MCK9688860.1 GNAT family N-acetyltransferase [Scleromatobacter humisilvae]
MPDFSALRLRTARLDLRPLAPADAPFLFALKSDAVVQRYGSHSPWTDPQQAVDYIERDRRSVAEGRHVQFAIVRREDDAVIGTCTLYQLDAQCRRADVGYALLPSAWGRGHANEAVTTLLDWGFEHLDLNRVEADIDPRNAASARALERLGFTREGHLRERWIVGGEVCDSLIYGLLAREWKARP